MPDGSQLIQVSRLTPGLGPDEQFGVSGVGAFMKPGEQYFIPLDLLVDRQQRIVVCGLWFTPDPDFSNRIRSLGGLVRFNPDGSVDEAFGAGGYVDFPATLGTHTSCAGVVESAGGYAAVGSNEPPVNVLFPVPGGVLPPSDEVLSATRTGRFHVFLVKFDQSGNLDGSFGDNGTAVIQGDFAPAPRIGLAPDDALVVSSNRFSSGEFFGFDLIVAKFNANGTPATDFADEGTLELVSPGPDGYGLGLDLAVAGDGTIWVGGALVDQQADGAPLRAQVWKVGPGGDEDANASRRLSEQLDRTRDQTVFRMDVGGDQRPVLLVRDNRTGAARVVQVSVPRAVEDIAIPAIESFAVSATPVPAVAGRQFEMRDGGLDSRSVVEVFYR